LGSCGARTLPRGSWREYSSAAADAGSLLATHVAAWAALWAAGSIQVKPADPPDQTGRARDIQSHLYSSFYYLLSSIREDWPHGALVSIRTKFSM
jgi:hypothetical protein